ncbi:hypothetical protein B0T14DRAFT_517043 [Immersiella caudata]|uniref:C2H2-type domain-containing protein n=1 Tax=Immersiella caudata TaxID=314043 RepID=A0AA40C3L6_9PEZI|nr:hypothetical protein B0T14DRAFT_517043 [Immersiella caudata]
MLSALWGPAEVVDLYLGSVATPQPIDTFCNGVDPKSLILRSTLHSSSSLPTLAPPAPQNTTPHPPSSTSAPILVNKLSSTPSTPGDISTQSPNEHSSLPSEQNSPSALHLASVTETSSWPTPPTSVDTSVSPSQSTGTPASSIASTSSRFACRESRCSGRAFRNQKDLDRHFDSIHGTDVFHCRCGKSEKRKDNQDRHVRKCRLDVRGAYRCPCGHTTASPKEYLTHISRRVRNRQTRRSECTSSTSSGNGPGV